MKAETPQTLKQKNRGIAAIFNLIEKRAPKRRPLTSFEYSACIRSCEPYDRFRER
jgi:hypothetical protein